MTIDSIEIIHIINHIICICIIISACIIFMVNQSNDEYLLIKHIILRRGYDDSSVDRIDGRLLIDEVFRCNSVNQITSNQAANQIRRQQTTTWCAISLTSNSRPLMMSLVKCCYIILSWFVVATTNLNTRIPNGQNNMWPFCIFLI